MDCVLFYNEYENNRLSESRVNEIVNIFGRSLTFAGSLTLLKVRRSVVRCVSCPRPGPQPTDQWWSLTKTKQATR